MKTALRIKGTVYTDMHLVKVLEQSFGKLYVYEDKNATRLVTSRTPATVVNVE